MILQHNTLTCLTELEALELAGGVALGIYHNQYPHTNTISSTHTLTSLSGFAMLGGGATGILGGWLDASG